ncbi:MAG: DUF4102 domain-containing protein, partial [Myxococcales bacterium FL481]
MVRNMLTEAGLRKQVRELEPGREHTIEVGGVEGLRLRIKKSGVASWTLRYRVDTGQRRVTFGRYPILGLGEARATARRLLGRISLGEDPSSQRKEARGGATVGDLWERYLDEHARPHKKPSSVRMDVLNWRNHLAPVLASIKIDAVTRADIAQLHAKIARPKTQARRSRHGTPRKPVLRGGKGVANRVLA